MPSAPTPAAPTPAALSTPGGPSQAEALEAEDREPAGIREQHSAAAADVSGELSPIRVRWIGEDSAALELPIVHAAIDRFHTAYTGSTYFLYTMAAN